MSGNRPIYVMIPLGSEDELWLYKSCASQSRLKGADVVAEIALLPDGDNKHLGGVQLCSKRHPFFISFWYHRLHFSQV
jgi:hypothetical protein